MQQVNGSTGCGIGQRIGHGGSAKQFGFGSFVSPCVVGTGEGGALCAAPPAPLSVVGVPDLRSSSTGSATPPPTNRGVESEQPSSCWSMDWLSYTVPEGSLSPDDVMASFPVPLAEWREMPRGLMGYAVGCRAHGIMVLSCGRPGMGVHVIISGEGFRYLRSSGDQRFSDCMYWSHTVSRQYHVTRCDVALDIVSDNLADRHIDDLEAAARERRISTHYREWEKRQKEALHKYKPSGKTLYFGASSSSSRVRVYDKREERLAAGDAVVPAVWERYEVQLREDRAIALLALLGGGDVSGVLSGLLLGLIDVKEVGQAAQKCLWATADWWAALIGWAAKLRLGGERRVRTLETVAAAVERQYGPIIALLLDHVPEMFCSLVNRSRGRITKRLERLLPEVSPYCPSM